MSSCLQSCVKDALRGIALLTALGALGLLLCGLHALSWATVTDLAVSWFALLASFLGGALCLLGCLGSLGLAPAIYCVSARRRRRHRRQGFCCHRHMLCPPAYVGRSSQHQCADPCPCS